METFSALLALLQRPVTRSFDGFFYLRLRWENNRKAGDLRRHRVHYVVNVMFSAVSLKDQ